VLALPILLPQPATAETELFYNCIYKILLLGNVDASIPIPQPPAAKSDVCFFKSFAAKDHPLELSLASDRIS